MCKLAFFKFNPMEIIDSLALFNFTSNAEPRNFHCDHQICIALVILMPSRLRFQEFDNINHVLISFWL